MFEGRVGSIERLNLVCDEVNRHYHVIGNLTAIMAKGYVCKACGKGCRHDVAHTCDQTCSSCLTSPPFGAIGVRIPCAICDRLFGARRVSPTIRGELEIRRPSVSGSDNAGHAVNSLAFRAHHTNLVSATVACALLAERLVTYVICSH